MPTYVTFSEYRYAHDDFYRVYMRWKDDTLHHFSFAASRHDSRRMPS